MSEETRSNTQGAAFRLLPSVEQVLSDPAVAAAGEGLSRELVLELVRALLDRWRDEIRAGELDADGLRARLDGGAVAEALGAARDRERRRGLVRVVNATGVVLHTGLGRAPIHPEAAEAMRAAASGYAVLEVERDSGKRNRRDDRLSELLCRLTGAEAGIVVNNNAAAVFLTLQALARGKEVVVSRGELVEIGGSFRVPDVMVNAGSRLREVGTTNRTRMDDYRGALGPDTGLLMKVHTSNFRIEGFSHEVTPDELAVLGAEHDLPTAFDLGSGMLEAEGLPVHPALKDEPRVRDAVASGVDIVTFSGDKLLGGPQAGLIVGKRAVIDRLRANPVYRALRLDKVTIAGLERTLELLLAGRGAELPAQHMLARTAAELEPEARALAESLDVLEGLEAEAVPEQSQPGSGSAPGVYLDTWCVRVRCPGASTDDLAGALRRGEPPVFCRIQDDALLLDPRTLLEGEAALVIEAFARLP